VTNLAERSFEYQQEYHGRTSLRPLVRMPAAEHKVKRVA
jgi:hypothetical protein